MTEDDLDRFEEWLNRLWDTDELESLMELRRGDEGMADPPDPDFDDAVKLALDKLKEMRAEALRRKQFEEMEHGFCTRCGVRGGHSGSCPENKAYALKWGG